MRSNPFPAWVAALQLGLLFGAALALGVFGWLVYPMPTRLYLHISRFTGALLAFNLAMNLGLFVVGALQARRIMKFWTGQQKHADGYRARVVEMEAMLQAAGLVMTLVKPGERPAPEPETKH